MSDKDLYTRDILEEWNQRQVMRSTPEPASGFDSFASSAPAKSTALNAEKSLLMSGDVEILDEADILVAHSENQVDWSGHETDLAQLREITARMERRGYAVTVERRKKKAAQNTAPSASPGPEDYTANMRQAMGAETFSTPREMDGPTTIVAYSSDLRQVAAETFATPKEFHQKSKSSQQMYSSADVMLLVEALTPKAKSVGLELHAEDSDERAARTKQYAAQLAKLIPGSSQSQAEDFLQQYRDGRREPAAW